MATTKTSGSTSPPDTSNLSSQISNALASADTTAAERIRHLQWVQQARVSQLSRMAAALKAQYGANDAGVKSAETAVAGARAAGARAAIVHWQMTTAEPEVSQQGWALHGRVFDAERNPVSGFMVFLVDATKAYQQAYGFAYTDDTGYFLLNYEGGAKEPSEGSATQQRVHSTDLFFGVADHSGRSVYVIQAAIQPVAGVATYHNIFLSEGNVGAPPAEILKVAAPKGKRKG